MRSEVGTDTSISVFLSTSSVSALTEFPALDFPVHRGPEAPTPTLPVMWTVQGLSSASFDPVGVDPAPPLGAGLGAGGLTGGFGEVVELLTDPVDLDCPKVGGKQGRRYRPGFRNNKDPLSRMCGGKSTLVLGQRQPEGCSPQAS